MENERFLWLKFVSKIPEETTEVKCRELSLSHNQDSAEVGCQKQVFPPQRYSGLPYKKQQ